MQPKSKSGGGPLCVSPPILVANGEACCADRDCSDGAAQCFLNTRYCSDSSSFLPGTVDCTGNTCTGSGQGTCAAGQFCNVFSTDQCTPETNPGGICNPE